MAGRPLGITILAILQLLGSLLLLIGAALVLIGGVIIDPILLLFAVLPLILGIIGLILFYGLWTLKGWAWIWTLIINILNIIFAVYPTVQLMSLVIPVIIVVYLLIPSTRAAFKQ